MIALHWLMTVLLMSMIGLGLFMGSLPRGHALKPFLLNGHVATGLLILLLLGYRLVLRHRYRSVRPALPSQYSRLRKRIAQSVHIALYALMLGLPLVGLGVWALDPFVGGPALFGEGVWISNAAGQLHQLHYLGAWLLFGLVLMHVLGGMSVDDQGRRVLHRMWPGKQ